MPHERVTILGIPFDKVTLEQAADVILDRLMRHIEWPFFVATPNPEMLLEARNNKPFKQILLQTDLNIPDGTGIVWASKVIKNPLPGRVTGTDLMQAICQKAGHGARIFLLGASPGVADKTKEILHSRYHSNVVGTDAGSADPSNDRTLQKLINEAAPDILFVAFGAPKQELWLARNLPHLDSVKAAIGVGGAFDFIAGIKKRAPQWMRNLGIEWLFRLFREPKRIKRIINATIVFPIVFLFSRR
jgi:N-acetylglucosaminyldiphosphoundecaprenol N-acetyl-beta-D-mannosaminyltransferase